MNGPLPTNIQLMQVDECDQHQWFAFDNECESYADKLITTSTATAV